MNPRRKVITSNEHGGPDRPRQEERAGARDRTETILTALFAAAPAGVAVLDQGLRFVIVNDAFARLSGMPARDHVGRSMAELIPRAEIDEVVRRVLVTGEPAADVRIEIASNGVVREHDASLFLVRDANGEALGVGVVMADVTERVRLQDQLREREVQLRTLADNLPQLTWMADAQGSRFWYNQRWFEYTGGTMEEARGRGWTRYHDPQTAADVVRRIDERCRGGIAWQDLVTLRSAKGEYRWFLLQATPIHDAEGRVLQWFGTNTDITEQRLLDQATAHLAESIEPENTFPAIARLAIPTLADFCFFDLLEGDNLRRVAWAHVDPVREAEWTQRVIPLVPELRAREHPVVRALATGETYLEPALTPDWFEQNVSLTSDQRAFYQAVGFNSVIVVPLKVHERTLGALSFGYCEMPRRAHTIAQKQLAEELARRAALAVENARHYEAARAAVSVREQVLAVVSHDLRNPLSTIDLAISSALVHEGAAPFRKHLEIAKRAIARMGVLITDLLDMASIQAGTLSVTLRSENAGAILDEVFEAHARRAADNRIVLTREPSLADVVVRCDRARILQALGNLTSNALKFTPPGGRVTLRGEHSKRDVRFEVADTGPGIPAAEVPHLFERYWTVSRGAQRGTGLGLFITKRIVDAHRGTISVDTMPGRGSTFRITLPRL